MDYNKYILRPAYSKSKSKIKKPTKIEVVQICI